MGQTKLSALPQSPPDAQAIAVSWLALFSKSLEAGDVDGVVSTFFPDGYLRDILIFTWNNRTSKGHTAIRAFLAPSLHAAQISNVLLDERQYFGPVYGAIGPSISGVSTGFTFETSIAKGQGYARLAEDEKGEWKAMSVFSMMDEFKGHGNLYPESGVYGGHTLAWNLVKEHRQRKIESDPHVIIVGAGQTGLNIGARLKQAGIPTLIIDKNSRVGDNWRKRYSTLTLHSPKPHTAMNFQDFPETWPTFTPRDKQADWLEQYAISQDLVVWTQSTLQPVPKHDPDTGRWTCIVTRGDKSLLLRPAHIILACGTIGAPDIPPIPSAPVFEGKTLHASSYDDGAPYAGKRVLVVGAGNTSADVCQDLVFHGAKSVTMVQRSVTTIVSCEKMTRMLQRNWPLDVPTAVSDFKYSSMPWGLMREFARKSSKKRDPDDMDTAMLEKLEAKGLKIGNGPKDNSGQVFLVFERFGGYWLDVGVADLIHEGKVKVKSGVEVSQFTPKTVIYSDGSEQEADVVIFAFVHTFLILFTLCHARALTIHSTGYKSVLESLKPLFGDEVIGKTELWGFDDEEELKGCYRPSGQPGLWYGAGNFYVSRFYSKQLALEIKAIELGYMKQ